MVRASAGSIAVGVFLVAVLTTILGCAMYYTIERWGEYTSCHSLEETQCRLQAASLVEVNLPTEGYQVLVKVTILDDETEMTHNVTIPDSGVTTEDKATEITLEYQSQIANEETTVPCYVEYNLDSEPTELVLVCPSMPLEQIVWTSVTVAYAVALVLMISWLYRRSSLFVLRPYRSHPMVQDIQQPQQRAPAASIQRSEISDEELQACIKRVDTDPEATCIICLDPYGDDKSDAVALRCQHVFHEKCIMQWLKGRGRLTCPVCKSPISAAAEAEAVADASHNA